MYCLHPPIPYHITHMHSYGACACSQVLQQPHACQPYIHTRTNTHTHLRNTCTRSQAPQQPHACHPNTQTNTHTTATLVLTAKRHSSHTHAVLYPPPPQENGKWQVQNVVGGGSLYGVCDAQQAQLDRGQAYEEEGEEEEEHGALQNERVSCRIGCPRGIRNQVQNAHCVFVFAGHQSPMQLLLARCARSAYPMQGHVWCTQCVDNCCDHILMCPQLSSIHDRDQSTFT